mmetsp:Transcript_27028/g.59598  ORF Transcript_27028/g.59598 Transcript_27028/m.59598 type:complete len:94 (+) Transcript_27028:2678-2959(+)
MIRSNFHHRFVSFRFASIGVSWKTDQIKSNFEQQMIECKRVLETDRAILLLLGCDSKHHRQGLVCTTTTTFQKPICPLLSHAPLPVYEKETQE